MTTTIADLTATMDAVHRQLSELRLEAARRLADLPDPGADLGALLAELSAATTDRTEHHSKRYPASAGRQHSHGECTAHELGAEPCACCADWSRVYERHEAAVRAVTRYALALARRDGDDEEEEDRGPDPDGHEAYADMCDAEREVRL